jgi:hypothetical protein
VIATGPCSFRARRFLPIFAAGLFHLTVLAVYLAPFHFDVSALVCLSERLKCDPHFAAIGVTFHSDGYDGQYYYQIALGPFRRQVDNIDLPCYRHARILYPVTAFSLSGGDPELLVWVMPLINLAAVMGTAWLGVLLASHYGRSVWWGLLLPIAVNSVTPSLRDMTDPLATLTTVGLLTAWILEWPIWALVSWGVAGVLSREQNITIVLILSLQAVAFRRWRHFAGLALVVAIWTVWLTILHAVYGVWPSSPANIGKPFAGMWDHWSHLEGKVSPYRVPVHILRTLIMASQFVAGLFVIARGERETRMIALAGVCLSVVASHCIYCDSFAYARVLNWVPLAIFLFALQNGKRWPVFVLLCAVAWPANEIARAWR